ncbi:DNA adenine methylase [Actinomyces lilanjuaniae]|uniref:site-specific DNA-methyltransferase (adenine-specific) n=1 Tax=Actinomyces lilanjuaniae TaxID=2321394 RepID=A0ABN5PTC6_9ACTO|nr:DNA adenine methylase [Actinomyces lilanjuaniae]AYD90140.1 DNA adenine methylase [Actinomyces lilanjuaniae]
MRYLSPLRYPGGKARLAPFLARVVAAQDPAPARYAEPYAGGAGAALRLLADGVVDHVHLNDLNPGIAAFWRTTTTRDGAEELCHLIDTTPVTISQWHHQRCVYQNALHQPTIPDGARDLALGFATFFLNRTNRSGILDARPIGGLDQAGRWPIDARYNKTGLKDRIRTIASWQGRVHVTQLDGTAFLGTLDHHGRDVLVYADPPYLDKAHDLYLHAFDHAAHDRLATTLHRAPWPWLLTYDDQQTVWTRLYPAHRCARFSIAHTAGPQHVGTETIVYSPDLTLPADLEVTPGRPTTWITSPAPAS